MLIPEKVPPSYPDINYDSAMKPAEVALRQEIFNIIAESWIGCSSPLPIANIKSVYDQIKSIRITHEDSLSLKLRSKFAYYEVQYNPTVYFLAPLLHCICRPVWQLV